MAWNSNKAKFDVEVEVDQDAVCEWANDNLEPEDVFDEKKLIGWARDHDPDELFEVGVLEEWAFANGYVKGSA